MARNGYLHDFAAWPKAMQGPRSGFDLSAHHDTTFMPGVLIPVHKQLCQPGDIIKGNASAQIRALAQFINPVFTECYVDTFVFWCPFRVLWKHWEEFEGENKSNAGMRTSEVVLPYFEPAVDCIKVKTAQDWDGSAYPFGDPQYNPSWGVDFVVGTNVGSLDSYLGYPVCKVEDATGSTTAKKAPAANGLDIVMYYRVANDYFRDQNLMAPLSGLDTFYNLASGASFNPGALFTSDIAVWRGLGGSTMAYSTEVTSGQICLLAPVCKYHDYFTSCLPTPSGQTVYMPLVGDAPLIAKASGNYLGYDLKLFDNAASSGALVSDQGFTKIASGTIGSTLKNVTYTNLYANLAAVSGVSVNTLRNSISAQLYYETLQMGGNRYPESRKSIWDETLFSDMIQRPEFLAGEHTLLNIQAVNNTSTANDIPVGKQSANSITILRGNGSYIKHVKEFGYIMHFMCIRYKHTYPQQLRRDQMLHRQFDFYNPFFDSIGNTPVYKDEIKPQALAANATTKFLSDLNVFGYQEAWADYRSGSVNNRVSGAFHPDAGLNDFLAWTTGDSYDSTPTLSSSWMCEDPTNILRCMSGLMYGPYAFGAEIDTNIIAYRHMKTRSIPSKLGM